jgi:hypothetical protein
MKAKGQAARSKSRKRKPEPSPITPSGTGPLAASVNEIGPFEGSIAASVPKGGIYLVQVQANGLAILVVLVAPCWVGDLEIAPAEVEAVFGPIWAAPPWVAVLSFFRAASSTVVSPLLSV